MKMELWSRTLALAVVGAVLSPLSTPAWAAEPVANAPRAEAPVSDDGVVNINTASVEELQFLPGVLAQMLRQELVDFIQEVQDFDLLLAQDLELWQFLDR